MTAELDGLLLDLISWAQLKTLLKSPGTNYIEDYTMRYNPFNGHTLWLLLLAGTHLHDILASAATEDKS